MSAGDRVDDLADGARAWRDAGQAAACDVLRPWSHGTIVRATRFPDYWDLNVVRVEDDPGMSAGALTALADEALAGLGHRRLDFDLPEVAEPLREELEARGWKATRLLWMGQRAPLPPAPELAVETVPYDAVRGLRYAWHQEDFPGHDPGRFVDQAREVALLRDVRVLAVREGEAPVAYAQLEREGPAAEITQVYVDRGHRGAGRGTAVTRAAIAAASGVGDLWICADDEDRAKELYARLGFHAAWTTVQFLRLL
jgi:ribosomal protein S18 acetylase RimI-like enzyme